MSWAHFIPKKTTKTASGLTIWALDLTTTRSSAQHIAQVHHEWTAPIALATDYCHPVEHALVNVLPNIAYAILIGSDPFSYLFW